MALSSPSDAPKYCNAVFYTSPQSLCVSPHIQFLWLAQLRDCCNFDSQTLHLLSLSHACAGIFVQALAFCSLDLQSILHQKGYRFPEYQTVLFNILVGHLITSNKERTTKVFYIVQALLEFGILLILKSN